MKIKCLPRDIKLYLTLPEMRVFWIYLALVAVNIVISAVFSRSLFWFLVSAVILIALSVVVFTSSFTAARANRELGVKQYQFRSIINDLKDGVIAYDNDFKVLVFNPAAEQIFGLRHDDVVGRSFSLSMRDRRDSPRFKLLLTVLFPSLAPVIRRRTEVGEEVQITDLSLTDPELEFRVVTSKIYDANRAVKGFIKIVRDRTRDVEILRSKSEFVTIASHQLRAPLTALSWVLETLQKESLSENQKDLVRIGVKATSSLLGIVNNLLDVAKIEEGKFGYQFQELNIIQFLEEVLKQAELIARQYHVNIYFDRPSQPEVRVVADPQKLGAVVSNLIDNAIKYNVQNGEVVVKVEVREDGFVQVGIHDTGIGIPPEVLDKIFMKFFRAENALKQVTDGTGLGLFIAKNVIHRHGGEIWVESNIDRGSTFFFTLPTDPSKIPQKEIVYEEA